MVISPLIYPNKGQPNLHDTTSGVQADQTLECSKIAAVCRAELGAPHIRYERDAEASPVIILRIGRRGIGLRPHRNCQCEWEDLT